ncbi:MAG: hypothetical protein MJZ88_01035 [Paludibacteraceae bacterium]|nr:hypothetical protein [Candidatus Colicola coprequi]MCQ2333181.1 hypothetical protein [Paludibacteraceae bacterium]
MGNTLREVLIYLGFVLFAGVLWWSLSREHHDQLLVTEHLKTEMKSKNENGDENRITEKVLNVAIEVPSMGEKMQVRLFPSQVKVIVRVSEDDYADVSAEHVRAWVSLGSSLERSDNDLLKVKVKIKDKRILSCSKVEPSEVEYLLEETK